MLVRPRVSRIYYLKSFFDYPVSLNFQTVKNLGLLKMIKIGFSYLKSLFNKRPEKSLEDFFINRFGRELYETFFRDYTEKLWGIHPSHLSADWGAQRVKGLSLSKAFLNALTKPFRKNKNKTETSLIEQFEYPKYGPGELYTVMAKKLEEKGVHIIYNAEVNKLIKDDLSFE